MHSSGRIPIIWRGTTNLISFGTTERGKGSPTEIQTRALTASRCLHSRPAEPALPQGTADASARPQDDPGRFRNSAFFDKMYGHCDAGETRKHLTKVKWLPASGGGYVEVTTVNGVADKLRTVAKEIEQLHLAIKHFAYPSAGGFNCRTVKDTGKRSMHAYGAAIDLNTKFADYWLWSPGGYRNRMPVEMVAIFERHGFIWGGKWGHFDTMHFEYRPELLLDEP